MLIQSHETYSPVVGRDPVNRYNITPFRSFPNDASVPALQLSFQAMRAVAIRQTPARKNFRYGAETPLELSAVSK